MLSNEYKIMNDFESNYWWYIGLHELILRFVQKKSQGKKISILDAGCGTGRMLELLSEHHTAGFDYSEEAVKFCKKKGLKNITLQNINNWKSEELYDVILSIDVICSIGIDDYSKIIKNFNSALNKNGILILNLPAFENLRRNHDKAVFVGKRFKQSEVKKILKKSGFEIDFISYRLPFLYFVILLKKNIQKIFKITKAESDLKKISKLTNLLMLSINRFENLLLKFFRNPFLGSSVFVVAKKTT